MSERQEYGPGSEKRLLAWMAAAMLGVAVLLAYQLWLGYREKIATAETVTRNFAAIFETRLDATLRRIEADLAEISQSIPRTALVGDSVARHAPTIDAMLDVHLHRFPEIAGYRVTDREGNTLYTNDSAKTARINVGDRGYFRRLRDEAALDLVFSEVVMGRSTGKRAIAIARAWRDGDGRFHGIVYAILRVDYLQSQLTSLNLGPQGVVVLRRSDDQSLVMRQPPYPTGAEPTSTPASEAVRQIGLGERAGTLEAVSPVDGLRRVISFRALERYPFYFVVGMGRDDILAGWRQQALVVAVSTLLALALTGALLLGFWRTRQRERSAVASLEDSRERYRCLSEASFESIFLSEKGLCVEQNARAEEMFGYTTAEAVGRPGTDWIAPDYRETVVKNMLSGYEQPYEVMARRKDGTSFHASIRGRMSRYQGRPVRVTVLSDISERKLAEEALRESESYNKLLFSGSHIPQAVLDPESFRIIDCNQAAADIYGLPSREAVLAISPADVSAPLQYDGRPSVESAAEHLAPALRDGSHTFEWRHQRPGGEVWDGEVRLMSFQHRGRTLLQFSLQDITERKRTEADLRIAATAFDSQEGMIITDADETILRVNRACVEITGYSAEDVVGKSPRVFSSGRHDPVFYREMWASIADTGAWEGEVWNRRKNGDVYPSWMTVSTVRGAGGKVTHYVASITDISLRKSAEDEIRSLAFYDPLTRLPNRRLLIDRLRHALAASARSESVGALLFIDLDNFKTLNDSRGHDKGDLLLESIARRLTACVREEDTVARLGGDEFVVMLEDLSAISEDAAALARQVGEKILQSLGQAHDLSGVLHECTASIGITLFAHGSDSVDELLKRADLAMYQAKAAGRNTMRFFDPGMQATVMKRAALELELREGIRCQQLLLYYQPQVDQRGRILGVEALVRWRHPEHGMVSPLDFIPLAEETGLIIPAGKWVLETACAQLTAWSGQPHAAHLKMAVNVSAREIRQPDFVEQVLAVIAASGAPPQQLRLELTETMLLEDIESIIDKMTRLKAEGVGFSLDDFGTGYSSLSYLKRLPLDHLKIDASFVRDVMTDTNDAAIARTIIALGHSMGLTVIAEGVETPEQCDFLINNGCVRFQGYWFGRPMPAADIDARLLAMPSA